MAIDISVPFSDGWWLNQLYNQLRVQQRDCEKLWKRYIGDAPFPDMNQNQRDAVKWFISKARTNFERLIVGAPLSRLRIRGIRTNADQDEGGDADAFKTWKRSKGKLWSADVHKMAMAMRRSYVMVGKDERGKLLVTAEDPRHVTAVTDPADPLRIIAAMKLVYDPARNEDVCWLYVIDDDKVRIRTARRDRKNGGMLNTLGQFPAQYFVWTAELDDVEIEDSEPDWLQGSGDREPMLPVVMFENDEGMAEFEPHIELLDRISQQILQRMTIATIQAFKQRAMKGLPQRDPETGEKIDYDNVFVSDPGAIWNIPQAVEIWESGAVDLQPILLAIRDDIKDLAAVTGTPLYTVTPDVANGSAEGASLQREQVTYKVIAKQDRWELSHEKVIELIFRTEGDTARAEPGGIEIMWAPAYQASMSERANAIAQTRGVIARYQQLIEIWGMDPATADRNMTQLTEDTVLDTAMAQAKSNAAGPPGGPPTAPGAIPNGQVPKFTPPAGGGGNGRPKGLPDIAKAGGGGT